MAAAMVLALALDALFGTPRWLRARIGDPADWFGWLFKRSETLTGRAGPLVAILAVALLTWLVQMLLPGGWLGVAMAAVLAWPFLAARALDDQLSEQAKALCAGDIAEGTAHNTLEQLAKGALQRVIAPLFWGALLGLPGIATYAAIAALEDALGAKPGNTALLARLADWLPTRLTGLLFALGAKARGTAFRTIRRDGTGQGRARAPWPEAALAGALGVRLRHPGRTDDPIYLNPVGGNPRPEDIPLALRLYRRAILFGAMGLALWAMI